MTTQEPTARLEPKPVPVDLDAHKKEKAHQQARIDEMREEHLKCLHPAYAAQKEHEKPVYKWTVTAKWLGPHDDVLSHLNAEETVVAQNEATAWAIFCDKIGCWPSRRDAKPIIKRGKQLTQEAVVAAAVAGVDEAEATIPTVTLASKPKPRKR